MSMRFITSLLLLCSAHCFSAVPPPPPAETVSQWIAFSKPVTLTSEQIKEGDFTRWGKPIWIVSYKARKQTLTSYVFALYERGSLFAEHRAELEAKISKSATEAKGIKVEGTDLNKFVHVDTRPDSRKVYFSSVGGFGGMMLQGFTSLPDYDLLVTQLDEAQDDTPDDQKLKDPAKATSDLPTVLQKLEQYLSLPK